MPFHRAIVGWPEVGGDPVDPLVVGPERRPEERGVPDAEVVRRKSRLRRISSATSASAERGQVGVRPGVVAQRHLAGVHQRPQRGGVVRPRAVAAVREEGQPDAAVGRERGERGRRPRCSCRRRWSAPASRPRPAGRSPRPVGGSTGTSRRRRGARESTAAGAAAGVRGGAGAGVTEARRPAPHGRARQAGGEDERGTVGGPCARTRSERFGSRFGQPPATRRTRSQRVVTADSRSA